MNKAKCAEKDAISSLVESARYLVYPSMLWKVVLVGSSKRGHLYSPSKSGLLGSGVVRGDKLSSLCLETADSSSWGT